MNKHFSLLVIFLFFLSKSLFAQISVINQKGTRITIDSSKWILSGTNIYNKNIGNVGLGNPSPTYKLDVTGKVRFTDSLIVNTARIITLNSGTVNDSILVSDPAMGVVKRISVARLNKNDSTTASNGLTVTGKNVQLGGILTGATSIITSATNTIALLGLQSGTASDSLVTINASGVLKRMAQPKKFTVIKTTTTQTTTSTTLTTINTLSFVAQAGKNYHVRLWIVYNAAATGTGISLGPNTFTGTGDVWYNISVDNNATTSQELNGYNVNTPLLAKGSRVTTNNTAFIILDLECTASGTMSFQFGSEKSGSAITIQPNSRLEYEITN